jgi:hypothetical protein
MLHLLVDYSPKTKFRARGLPGKAIKNFKSQIPNKSQAPNPNDLNDAVWDFEFSSLEFI